MASRLRSRLGTGIAVALVVTAITYFLVFGGEYSWFDLHRVRDSIKEEEARIEQLRADIDSLTLLADSLRSDIGLLERVARERYGMIKPGEVLYRFVEPTDSGVGHGR